MSALKETSEKVTGLRSPSRTIVVFFAVILTPMGSLQAEWSQQSKLTASDGLSEDYFGQSVSISGNYTLVGACGDQLSCYNNAGSVHGYKGNGTGWGNEVKIGNPNPYFNDHFGYSVSIDGNYAIVGAYQDDDKGNNSGSAYIFKYDGTTWTQQAKLTSPFVSPNANFGWSVSISGNHAIVGAKGLNQNQGAAHIFERGEGDAWTWKKKITDPNGSRSDYFGYSVSIDGDYAVIGAPHDGGSCTGSAFICKRDAAGNWANDGLVKITASDGSSNDYFGWSVSIDGQYVAAGAYKDDLPLKTNPGSAYIFKKDSAAETWSQQAKLIADDYDNNDNFGYSISIDGDRVIVGANNDDHYGGGYKIDAGSAYVFKRLGENWSQDTKLISNDADSDDHFGCAVSIDNHYAIVGAFNDDGVFYTDSGSAYVFYEIPEPTTMVLLTIGGIALLRRRRG